MLSQSLICKISKQHEETNRSAKTLNHLGSNLQVHQSKKLQNYLFVLFKGDSVKIMATYAAQRQTAVTKRNNGYRA